MEQLNDRANIIDTLNRFVLSIDTRDYGTMRSCLTDAINFDYTALFGTIMPKTADQLVKEVRANHQGFRAVQHMTTNHLVDVDSDVATCHVNFQAQHFLPNERGGNLWTLGGRYDYRLVRTETGWKIQGCVISVAWTDGNLQLFELAQQQSD